MPESSVPGRIKSLLHSKRGWLGFIIGGGSFAGLKPWQLFGIGGDIFMGLEIGAWISRLTSPLALWVGFFSGVALIVWALLRPGSSADKSSSGESSLGLLSYEDAHVEFSDHVDGIQIGISGRLTNTSEATFGRYLIWLVVLLEWDPETRAYKDEVRPSSEAFPIASGERLRRGESVGFAVADSNRLLKSTAGVSVDLNDLKLRKAILRLVCDGKARDEQLQFSCGGDEPTEIVPVPANSSAWLNSVALGEKIVFLEGEVSRYKSASQQVERQLSVEKDKLDKCHGERDEAISRAEWSVKRLQSMEIAMRSWEPPKNHPVVCIRYRDSDDRDLAEGLAAGFKGEGAAWVVSVEDSTIGKNPRQETRVVLFSNRTDSGALVHCLKWFLPGDGQDAAERKLTAWPSREGQEADVEIQVFDHVWKP